MKNRNSIAKEIARELRSGNELKHDNIHKPETVTRKLVDSRLLEVKDAIIAELKAACEFYGDADNWEKGDVVLGACRSIKGDMDHVVNRVSFGTKIYYGGKRARAALKRARELGGT